MANISESQRQHLIELLENGHDVPSDYRYLLFPPERQEYELVFADKRREEDILAETMALPFQPIREFGAINGDWHNKLIFGDNLQTLKTLLQMKERGEFVNADGKRGIKLVYIDPPFGTGDEYGPSDGEMSYSAKIQGAKFISFLRKRLIFIRDLLADNGTVFVRLDYHFGHYIKAIMDEVFHQSNFRNDIVINRVKKSLRGLTRFNVSTEMIFLYSKGSSYYFKDPEAPRKCNFCGTGKEGVWGDMTSPGLRNPPERIIFGKTYLPRRGRHFSYTQVKIDGMERDGRLRVNEDESYFDLNGDRIEGRPEFLQSDLVPVDDNWTDIKGYAFGNDYPTENHEELLERVLLTGSVEGDIVLDAFAGSGTTLAVAEKMKRRWIGVDCGKLSIYTIQKRMLNLRVQIGNKGRSLKHSPFVLYNAGLYDFTQLKNLPRSLWRSFALDVFQCQDKPHKVGGIEIDGLYRGDDVLVFDHTVGGGVVLDYGYIDDLHLQIGSKVGSQFFIIAPAASVSFLEDYIDKGSVRYYILRIPYSIINELHEHDFKAISQPEDESHVNDTIDAVGFDFIRQPTVECDYVLDQNSGGLYQEAVIKIKVFKSKAFAKGASEKGNRETLSMVLVDYKYPYDASKQGNEAPSPFQLDNRFYAKELASADWNLRMPMDALGSHIMIIYIDIYGNEYTEIKSATDFVPATVGAVDK